MRTTYLSFFLILAGCLCRLSHAANPMWTSLNGQHQFEGAFVSLLGEDLTLKGADEKEVTVPLTSLNEESRARGLALASGAIRLRDGFLWYYETPAYRLALFKGNTVAVIQFLDQGKAIVFPPIKLEMVHHEVNGTEFLYKGFTEMAAPLTEEGKQIIWRGRFSNDNEVEFRIDLNADGFSFDYRFIQQNPSTLNPKLRAYATVPEILSYDSETETYSGLASPTPVPFAQLEERLKNYQIVHKSYEDRRSVKVPFSSSMSGSLSAREEIAYQGPFSRKSIVFNGARKSGDGVLSMWFYEGGRRVFSGSGVRFLYPELPGGDMPEARFSLSFK